MPAFDAFLDAKLEGLTRYAAALTGDRDRAHDVLADALEKAQRRWDRIGRMDHPSAYVRRIVTSTFLSQQRRWSVRMIRPTRSGRLPDVAMPDPTGMVDDRAEIAALVTALPPRQRAVVVLRYYAGVAQNDIAAEMGISPGAVRTAHSAAMRKLRIALDRADESAGADELAGADQLAWADRPEAGPDPAEADQSTEAEQRSTRDTQRPTVTAAHGMSSYLSAPQTTEQP